MTSRPDIKPSSAPPATLLPVQAWADPLEHGMTGIDFADERFIDPDNLEAHRRRELPIAPFSGEHPGIVVAACGQAAWVDREIAELIYWMWRAGVRTTEACQDFLGDPADQRIFVAFGHPDDLCLFLSLVAPQDDEPGGLWDRATGRNLTADDNGMWDYEAGPEIRGREVTLHLCVIIPHSDGPELVRRLQQHVSARRQERTMEVVYPPDGDAVTLRPCPPWCTEDRHFADDEVVYADHGYHHYGPEVEVPTSYRASSPGSTPPPPASTYWSPCTPSAAPRAWTRPGAAVLHRDRLPRRVGTL